MEAAASERLAVHFEGKATTGSFTVHLDDGTFLNIHTVASRTQRIGTDLRVRPFPVGGQTRRSASQAPYWMTVSKTGRGSA